MIALILAALSTTPPPDPNYEERVFQRASELAPWCRQEAEAYFAGRGITTYQWTASYRDEGKLLVVEGKIRAEGRDVRVLCRIARGAPDRYASVQVFDQ